jgi:hypothetical protein
MVNNALINDVQQGTPYGTLGYQYTETPSGIPEITASQTLSGPQQGLLNTYQGTQQNLANTGNQLSQNIQGGGYGNVPNFLSQSSPQVQAQMAAYQGYMQPFYNMQTSNLNSMLQNQGIPQGSQAWNNAQMGLDTSMNQGAQSALMNFEPQAFNQAVANYQIPLQTASGLMSAGTPASLNQSFYNTPQSGFSQPPNYQQAAQNQYQAQQNQFQNTMGDLGGVFGNLTGANGLLGPLVQGAGKGIAGLFGL